MKQFDRFWKAYPKRNGKKVGKYPCSLWFEAKKPDDDTVTAMVKWVKLSISNQGVLDKEGKFCSPLPDPVRFLKNRMWEDEIDAVVSKKDRFNRDRAKQVREDNLSSLQDQYILWLAERPITEIKSNKQFMGLSRSNPEFAAWALEQRPDLKGAKADNPPCPPPVEVKKPAPEKVEPVAEPPPDRLAKHKELYRDVVEYKNKKMPLL